MGKDKYSKVSFAMGSEQLLHHINRLKDESISIQRALSDKSLKSKMSTTEYKEWRDGAKLRLETTNASLRNAKQRLRELSAIRNLSISEIDTEQANSEYDLLVIAYNLLKGLTKRVEFTDKEYAIMSVVQSAIERGEGAKIDL